MRSFFYFSITVSLSKGVALAFSYYQLFTSHRLSPSGHSNCRGGEI